MVEGKTKTLFGTAPPREYVMDADVLTSWRQFVL